MPGAMTIILVLVGVSETVRKQSPFFLCGVVCVCVQMHVLFMHMCVHMYVCMYRLDINPGCCPWESSFFLLFPLKQNLLPGTHQVGYVSCPESGISTSLAPLHWDEKHMPGHPFFT